MKPISNQIMLIAYPDCMGSNLDDLERILEIYFPDAVKGLHILPFFPSSGDRGFAPIDYFQVDPAFGTWENIRRLGEKYYLMADFMINHISVRSNEFKDYMAHGEESPYKDMFIRWDEFWPDGEPTAADLDTLYRRKQAGPYKECILEDGTSVRLWNTFWEEQIDLNPFSQATRVYYAKNLRHLAHYVPLIRFDAFAYASKRPHTSCFFVEPEVWQVLEAGIEPLRETHTQILPEVHEDYHFQLKIAQHGHWVYDFALPMLLLHALMTGRTDRLIHWLRICPRKQFTTLDTHDGIGVVDVRGLLSEDEIDLVREKVLSLTQDARKYVQMPSFIKQSGREAKTYQLNCTFYSALEENDDAYLLARAVQFFSPGIPQVYYVGMLAGRNDIAFLKQSGQGRDINRHYYTEAEIAQEIQRPVVKRLLRLMRLRNQCPAFDGDFSIGEASGEGRLQLIWNNKGGAIRLSADFTSHAFSIEMKTPTEAWHSIPME